MCVLNFEFFFDFCDFEVFELAINGFCFVSAGLMKTSLTRNGEVDLYLSEIVSEEEIR